MFDEGGKQKTQYHGSSQNGKLRDSEVINNFVEPGGVMEDLCQIKS